MASSERIIVTLYRQNYIYMFLFFVKVKVFKVVKVFYKFPNL